MNLFPVLANDCPVHDSLASESTFSRGVTGTLNKIFRFINNLLFGNDMLLQNIINVVLKNISG